MFAHFTTYAYRLTGTRAVSLLKVAARLPYCLNTPAAVARSFLTSSTMYVQEANNKLKAPHRLQRHFLDFDMSLHYTLPQMSGTGDGTTRV